MEIKAFHFQSFKLLMPQRRNPATPSWRSVPGKTGGASTSMRAVFQARHAFLMYSISAQTSRRTIKSSGQTISNESRLVHEPVLSDLRALLASLDCILDEHLPNGERVFIPDRVHRPKCTFGIPVQSQNPVHRNESAGSKIGLTVHKDLFVLVAVHCVHKDMQAVPGGRIPVYGDVDVFHTQRFDQFGLV